MGASVSSWISFFVVFTLGCILGWWINGRPMPGYEAMWYLSAVFAGVITTVPVIVFLALKWLMDRF